jgi:hypothetical protein
MKFKERLFPEVTKKKVRRFGERMFLPCEWQKIQAARVAGKLQGVRSVQEDRRVKKEFAN